MCSEGHALSAAGFQKYKDDNIYLKWKTCPGAIHCFWKSHLRKPSIGNRRFTTKVFMGVFKFCYKDLSGQNTFSNSQEIINNCKTMISKESIMKERKLFLTTLVLFVCLFFNSGKLNQDIIHARCGCLNENGSHPLIYLQAQSTGHGCSRPTALENRVYLKVRLEMKKERGGREG